MIEYNDIIRYPEGVIDLRLGMPHPDTYPMSEIGRAFSRIVAKELAYVPNEGLEPLRRRLAGWLLDHSGVNVTHEDILITNGSMEGIFLVTHVLGEAASYIATEAPGYWRAFEIFRNHNSNILLHNYGVNGFDMDNLEADIRGILRDGRSISFYYCVPSIQNPTGQVMDVSSRHKLLDLATRFDFMILEDDSKAQLNFEKPLPPTLYSLCRDNRVILLGTLSKFVCPGLRIGWMVGPKHVLSRVAALKPDGGTNPLASYVADGLIELIDWKSRFNFLRDFYKGRIEAAITCLRECQCRSFSWLEPKGGFFIWVQLGVGVNLTHFDINCSREGVALLRGEAAGCSNDPYGVRLSFAGVDHTEIRDGVERFSAAVKASICS